MATTLAKEIYILGLTRQGRAFRPSDWAERLAGVMSQFRPGGPQPGSHLGYSPWCIPTSIGDTKCVIIHPDLREHQAQAGQAGGGVGIGASVQRCRPRHRKGRISRKPPKRANT